MKTPEFPKNERQRLAAVQSYQLLDTAEEEDFDEITTLIANICETPISLITLLDQDRNFLKSHHGVPFNESPRNISFCGHAILGEGIFIIPDARQDDRFHDNPLVSEHGAIFYAGVPLVNPEGFKLGTLCVFDQEPKQLSDFQKNTLETLAKQVVRLYELRRKNNLLSEMQDLLKDRNYQLRQFAGVVSHDLKSPLATITSLINLLREDQDSQLSTDALLYLEHIMDSSKTLRNYIDGILNYYKTDELSLIETETINASEFFSELKELFSEEDVEIVHPEAGIIENMNPSALSLVFINLITNALKYNDKPKRKVLIEMIQQTDEIQFKIKDNGVGIPEDKIDTIFKLFCTAEITDRNGNIGTGIGLTAVQNIISRMGGSIGVISNPGEGSTFSFNVKN